MVASLEGHISATSSNTCTVKERSFSNENPLWPRISPPLTVDCLFIDQYTYFKLISYFYDRLMWPRKPRWQILLALYRLPTSPSGPLAKLFRLSIAKCKQVEQSVYHFTNLARLWSRIGILQISCFPAHVNRSQEQYFVSKTVEFLLNSGFLNFAHHFPRIELSFRKTAHVTYAVFCSSRINSSIVFSGG